jgi:2-C-methyl-D-erythritol 4-phosphate cytidylyltransferase
MSAGAILLCAGKGERLGRGSPKALVPLAGRPLFTHGLEALERCPAIEGIVLVGPKAKLEPALAAMSPAPGKVVGVTEGGRERQDSVARGLATLPRTFDVVVVHDSARALASTEMIGRVIADALQFGAAIAAIPVEDTLKRATLATVNDTVPRAGLWRAQTPQVFRRDWLEAAHAEAHGKATDDAALVEALGKPVRLTMGEATNVKITTPEDLELAKAWLAHRAGRASRDVSVTGLSGEVS